MCGAELRLAIQVQEGPEFDEKDPLPPHQGEEQVHLEELRKVFHREAGIKLKAKKTDLFETQAHNLRYKVLVMWRRSWSGQDGEGAVELLRSCQLLQRFHPMFASHPCSNGKIIANFSLFADPCLEEKWVDTLGSRLQAPQQDYHQIQLPPALHQRELGEDARLEGV